MEQYTILRFPKDKDGDSGKDAAPIKEVTLRCSKAFLEGITLAGYWLFGILEVESNLDVKDSSGEFIDSDVLRPVGLDDFDSDEVLDANDLHECGRLILGGNIFGHSQQYPVCAGRCIPKYRQTLRKLCARKASALSGNGYHLFYPDLANNPCWALCGIADVETFLGIHWGFLFFEEDMKNVEGFLFLDGVEIEDAKGFPEACAGSVEVGRFFADKLLVADVVKIVKRYMTG